LEILASLQHRASRNYFRLREADRHLHARARGDASRSVGRILADALEAERQRLGRELHTGVGQALAGIHVHVSLIEEAMPEPPAPVRRSLSQIAALARTALEQVRNVSRTLYVPAWQAHPLVDALRELWNASGISERFSATLDLHPLSTEPAPEVRRAVYLAAQEGISNAIQHSGARRVRLSLSEEAGCVVLEVADDGAGFHAPAESVGIGLRSMRDLVRQLGGYLEAKSTPEGTRLTVSLPVTHE